MSLINAVVNALEKAEADCYGRIMMSAEFLDVLLDVLRDIKWTSVDVDLPENRGIYITTNRFGEVEPMRYNSTGCWCSMGGAVYGDGWVTHWMPLPEPPGEVVGDG